MSGDVLDRENLTLVLIISVISISLLFVGFLTYQIIEIISEDEFEGVPIDPPRNITLNDTKVYACNDGIDNDGDGYIDMADFGCANSSSDSEVNKGNTQCTDGIDNDGDGKIDQADSDCLNRADDDEGIPPPTNISCIFTDADWNVSSAKLGERVRLEIEGRDCQGQKFNVYINRTINDANQTLVDQKINVTFTGNITYLNWTVNDNVNTNGFNFILPILIFSAFALFKFRDEKKAINILLILIGIVLIAFILNIFGSVFIDETYFSPPEVEYYFVAQLSNSSGKIKSDKFNLIIESNQSACNDGIDNDGDGKIDINDPGCWRTGTYNINGTNETDVFPACSNYFDDDGDNLTDYPSDPSCFNEFDFNETGFCGDGFVNHINEQCDDGNNNTDDFCDNACQFTLDLVLWEPQHLQQFNTTQNIPLNYTIERYSGIFSYICYLELNGQRFNLGICNAHNYQTINVPSNGTYFIEVFANFTNSSLGSGIISDSANFSIVL